MPLNTVTVTLQVLCNLWITSLIGGSWAIYWPTSWLTVGHYVGHYIGWVSIKSWSTYWWTVIAIALVGYRQCMISEPSVEYGYRLTIGIACTIFFPTSSLRFFPLLQGTCQLTHGRHYCLLQIFAAADTGLIRYQIIGYFHVSAWHLGCLSVAVSVAISDKYQASVSWESTKVLAIMSTKYWSMVCQWSVGEVTADYRPTFDS